MALESPPLPTPFPPPRPLRPRPFEVGGAETARRAQVKARARRLLTEAGMTPEDLATVMGVSPEAVRRALRRDRQQAAERPSEGR